MTFLTQLRRRPPILLAIAAIGLAACGGGGNREEAIANLTSGSDALTQEQAECVVDEVGEDKLADFDNFSPEFQAEVEDQFEDVDPSNLGEAAGDLGELLGAFFTCAFADLGGALSEGFEGLGEAVEGEEGFVFDTTPVDCATADVDGPCDYGDDPDLDALWDQCEAGDGEACDELYFESPFGSRYEQFGDRCGDREDPGASDCATKYTI